MELVIKPRRFLIPNFRELWQYRDFFYFLAWRDIKVRYRQTALGIIWAILQPFLMMVVFSVFFGWVAGLSSGDVPYPIFLYTGLIFWNYFSNSLSAASGSLVSHQGIIQKIYFPRILLPSALTLAYLFDFFFASLIFIGLLIYYHFIPTVVGILLIIPSILITFLSFSGLGLILASLNVKYRDVRYALPFFLQLLIFVTPVIYQPAVLGRFQWLWYLNPMAGVIETMRAGLLGIGSIPWLLFGVSVVVSVLIFIIGIFYFQRTERSFADII